MFKKSAIAAIAIAVSSTAFAASAGDQLALRLGVEPGVFTTAELIQLDQAREDNDKAIENFILSKADATSRASAFATTSNETILTAYNAANNSDDQNHGQADAFARAVNGEFDVSDATVARAQALFAASDD